MSPTNKGAVNPKESVGVVVWIAGNRPDAAFLPEILLGLEEEGMPFAVSRVEIGAEGIRALARRAAEASVFDIGLGCSDRVAVLHHAKLPPHKPVFAVPDTSMNSRVARGLGMNAARLVKKRPLVKID